MMRYPVPQFINVEDKIAGPLTWKQLYWMIALGALSLLLWRTLPLLWALAIGVPVGILLLAFAFYKPWGQPLTHVLWYALVFVFRPKLYTWQRSSSSPKTFGKETPYVSEPEAEDPGKTLESIRQYAHQLDNPEALMETPDTAMTKQAKRGIIYRIVHLFK